MCDLLDSSLPSQLRTNLIHQVFLPFEAAEILKVPLFPYWNVDKMVWGCTRNGHFSVRLAYHLVLQLRDATIASSSSHVTSTITFWKDIWHLKLPKKKLWGACNGSLPTKSQLHHCKIVDSCVCDFRLVETENVYHALCKCFNI